MFQSFQRMLSAAYFVRQLKILLSSCLYRPIAEGKLFKQLPRLLCEQSLLQIEEGGVINLNRNLF